jgi:selenoprotein W-related protein
LPATPTIEITYCRLCGWGLRAGWMAQELLATFAAEIGSVALTPDATGGVFEVRVDGELLWSRKERGRFPEMKELKQLVRDRIAPGRSLGHSDKA